MIAFSLGSLHIYWYGIFYAVSFLCAYFFLRLVGPRIAAKFPAYAPLFLQGRDDILIFAVLGVLIGGRLGHIIIYNLAYYLAHPLEIVMVWKGGMSFIGGILGVVVSFFLLTKKYHFHWRVFLVLGDVLLPVVALGIGLGRIGNFLNQELYGIIAPHNVLLQGLGIYHVYPQVDSFLRVNTNMLSSVFEGFLLCVFLGILLYSQISGQQFVVGRITGWFLVWYSVVRFLLEYVRADSQLEFVGLFSLSQWFFLVFFVLGIVLLFWSKKGRN